MTSAWKRILAMLLAICLLTGCTAFAEEEEIVLEEIIEEVELTDEEEEDLAAFAVTSEEQALLENMAITMERDTTTDPTSLDMNENLPDHVINILLVGIDTREAATTAESESAARGDVQMILSINTQDGSIKLSSILRDTYVVIPGYKNSNRINVAYQYGGGQLAMRTINRNFDMNIQYYVVVNFYGLASIIDAIGGIDVDLTKIEAGAINTYLKKHPPKYDNTNGKSRVKLERKAGVQHLDGVQAVMYARLREIDNDFNRTARQRHLLELLLNKIMQDMDINVLLNLINVALQYAYTNVDIETIFSLASTVMTSGIMERAQNGEKLIDDFRIPMDKCYSYKTINGASVIYLGDKASGNSNFMKNTRALHEFIYGEYIAPN